MKEEEQEVFAFTVENPTPFAVTDSDNAVLSKVYEQAEKDREFVQTLEENNYELGGFTFMAVPHQGPWVVKGEEFEKLVEKNRQGKLKRKENLGQTTVNSNMLREQSVTWDEFLASKGLTRQEEVAETKSPLKDQSITFEEYKVLKRTKK